MNIDKVIYLLATNSDFAKKAKTDLKAAASSLGVDLTPIEADIICEVLARPDYLTRYSPAPEELPTWRVSSWNLNTSRGTI